MIMFKILRSTWRRFLWRLREPGPLDYAPWKWTRKNDSFWAMPRESRMRRYEIDRQLWKEKEPR